MAKIAVIKTGGKQYRVQEGEVVKIEKLDKKINDKVSFDTLLVAEADGQNVNIGTPSLGEKVTGEIVGEGKADKVTVVKYKNKTRYKRTLGHRQPFLEVKITSIA
ncbi:50S ribosomal protein L21 [Candidatus Falkowbacteria bacterium CG10_big_fil_rev_8_21_14_0_10_39_9]|uniref:Large ribosomal subunit protein bL21 n=1 Tax=Candidatus Falkowbacteria bacterium CG10_big_fil_rev_8_21_14_0_10_39_9 TaxID=1974566 RepID=A0A2M6WRI1_9BACT|nr:MAG: 50S ribosomal protein L21 [Candidatus Falkowbacteria bacterium CG10_big_fil_rev_8_21_14_0_10_39_9]